MNVADFAKLLEQPIDCEAATQTSAGAAIELSFKARRLKLPEIEASISFAEMGRLLTEHVEAGSISGVCDGEAIEGAIPIEMIVGDALLLRAMMEALIDASLSARKKKSS